MTRHGKCFFNLTLPSHPASLPPLSSFVENLFRKISCGAAHTACVTASGQLFVWGCGDGGRLGLGEERMGHQFEPVLVEALASAGEKIGSVSCGNSHTLVRYFMVRRRKLKTETTSSVTQDVATYGMEIIWKRLLQSFPLPAPFLLPSIITSWRNIFSY